MFALITNLLESLVIKLHKVQGAIFCVPSIDAENRIPLLFNRNTTPSVATLEMICKGFGITLAQFFAEGSMIELTEEQQTMFEAWRTLSPEQKDAISHLISVMKK